MSVNHSWFNPLRVNYQSTRSAAVGSADRTRLSLGGPGRTRDCTAHQQGDCLVPTLMPSGPCTSSAQVLWMP